MTAMLPLAHRLILPYPPPTNRLYRRRQGQHALYPSAEAKAFHAQVAAEARAQGVTFGFVGPVCLTVHVYRPQRSGDLDGRLKALLDALQGVCYADDKQIVEIHAYRLDDKARPRVEVVVEAAEGSAPECPV